jgi:hypothetical protein
MSEKLLETLFTRFTMQSFGLGGTWVHAPSAKEEFVNGYDMKIVGMKHMRELILQFKKPRITKDGFGFSTVPHQHKALRTLYPPHTAYYVSSTFRTMTEIQDAQRNIRSSLDFLKYYVCIEIVSSLPHDLDFIQYERDESLMARSVKYKCENDGAIRRAQRPLKGRGCWESGSGLINKFKRRAAGSIVELFDLRGIRLKAQRRVEQLYVTIGQLWFVFGQQRPRLRSES